MTDLVAWLRTHLDAEESGVGTFAAVLSGALRLHVEEVPVTVKLLERFAAMTCGALIMAAGMGLWVFLSRRRKP